MRCAARRAEGAKAASADCDHQADWAERSIRAEDQSLCSVRDEIHRDSVDAVAEMGRWRAVIKDMSKMATTIRAVNLGSDHAEGSINGCLDGTLDRIIEAGPTGAAFELLL